MTDYIATDSLLTAAQKIIFDALVDTLVPASEETGMPAASEVDVLSYIIEQAPDFSLQLPMIVDNFDRNFAASEEQQRVQKVQAFEQAQPKLFSGLLFHTYARYYQNDRVLEALGLSAGPPFPTGNTLAAGDLALLDPVMEHSRGYRKVSDKSA